MQQIATDTQLHRSKPLETNLDHSYAPWHQWGDTDFPGETDVPTEELLPPPYPSLSSTPELNGLSTLSPLLNIPVSFDSAASAA
ncbi:hypothetical protein V502_08396 [Pseudogymnoascus sp. VKM F-4520 (FW-2644)]|nr:hypothetical protein V502_08396 [Pseudogymnoascus sp. VKM F-4520 (FW-2644)]